MALFGDRSGDGARSGGERERTVSVAMVDPLGCSSPHCRRSRGATSHTISRRRPLSSRSSCVCRLAQAARLYRLPRRFFPTDLRWRQEAGEVDSRVHPASV